MAKRKMTKCAFCDFRILGQRGCVGKKKRSTCPNYLKKQEAMASKNKRQVDHQPTA